MLRIGYFLELNSGPCIWQHRWDQSDMNFFDSWARQIAAGDWACENVDPPVHDWHRRIAQSYYQRNPGELRAVQAAAAVRGEAPDPPRVLWNRWAGERRFYQGPLYPYLIALTYKIWTDVRCVFIWQMLLGVLTNVLIYLLARRIFGEIAAAPSGLIACFYSPLLHSELILLRETLVVFAAIGMVYLAILASERRKFWWWTLAGGVMGLSLLHKAHFGLFVIGTVIILAIELRRSIKLLMRCGAGLGLGLILGLSPLVVRNVAVGVSPLSTASSAGPAFALWNSYEPGITGEAWRLEATSRIMEQTGGKSSVFFPTLRTHPNVVSYLRLPVMKFSRAWGWYEKPDSANFYYYRLHSATLRIMPFTFFLLSPVAILGLALAVRRFYKAKFLYLQVLTNLTALVMFSTVARFRLPMAAALIPFAAFAVVQVAQWAVEKRYAPLIGALIPLGIVWVWTARPLPPGTPAIRPTDYKLPYTIYYAPRMKPAFESGQWLVIIDLMSDMMRYEPDYIRHLGPGNPPDSSPAAELAIYYRDMHNFYAQILARAHRVNQAREQQRIAENIASAVRQVLPPAGGHTPLPREQGTIPQR